MSVVLYLACASIVFLIQYLMAELFDAYELEEQGLRYDAVIFGLIIISLVWPVWLAILIVWPPFKWLCKTIFCPPPPKPRTYIANGNELTKV